MKSSRVVTSCFVLGGLAVLTLYGCGSSTDGGGTTGTGGQTASVSGSGGRSGSGGEAGSGGKVGLGGSAGTGVATGAAGSGGAVGNGGTGGSGGRTGGGTTGPGGGLGGAAGVGGTTAIGQPGSGGAPATGGGPGTGGRATGGTTGSGGSMVGGGATGTGGSPMSGGNSGGGTRSTGGVSGAGGATRTGGSTGTGTCPHVQMRGTDVCTIGDSWIQLQGNQVTTLEDHMVAAGVIPKGDHFDRREVSGSTLDAIIKTYTNKPSNCKLLVMDGGGIDLFSTPAGQQSAIDPVVQKFKDFLVKVKSDGYVQHIIYSLYPVIPTTPNLNKNMGPGFTAACAASAVDCHVVDLEPLFQGQHFASDRTHADVAGGVIIGDAWWKAMQQYCIAQ